MPIMVLQCTDVVVTIVTIVTSKEAVTKVTPNHSTPASDTKITNSIRILEVNISQHEQRVNYAGT